MSRRIVVAGGHGFLGSAFIRHVLSKYPHYHLINVDKTVDEKSRLKDISGSSDYEFVRGDINDELLIGDVTRGSDAIINFADLRLTDHKSAAFKESAMSNIIGTQNLIEAGNRWKISRFMQVSTYEVYGDTTKGPAKESQSIDPDSLYAISKASGDLLCRAYRKEFDMSIIIVRPSDVFGPYQSVEQLVPSLIIGALDGKGLPLVGEGKSVRDWLHVDDLCRALDTVLHLGIVGQIYNVASGQEIADIDLANEIAPLAGRNPSEIILNHEPVSPVGHRADPRKVKNLGWAPEYKLDKALGATIGWYKENRWWWAKQAADRPDVSAKN